MVPVTLECRAKALRIFRLEKGISIVDRKFDEHEVWPARRSKWGLKLGEWEGGPLTHALDFKAMLTV